MKRISIRDLQLKTEKKVGQKTTNTDTYFKRVFWQQFYLFFRKSYNCNEFSLEFLFDNVIYYSKVGYLALTRFIIMLFQGIGNVPCVLTITL